MHIPNTAIVPPVRAKTPHAPTFCLVRVFWTVETKRPATEVTPVAFTASPTASLGWKICSAVPSGGTWGGGWEAMVRSRRRESVGAGIGMPVLGGDVGALVGVA